MSFGNAVISFAPQEYRIPLHAGAMKTDVAIIGGGLAGSVLATVLARRKVNVTLIEPKRRYPECFKAEKLEPDQWQLLQKYNILETVLPVCERIEAVQVASSGRMLGVAPILQYGYSYHDLVNRIREDFPDSLNVIWDRVTGIHSSDDIQQLELSDGTHLQSRLAVVATGNVGRLHKELGTRKAMVSRQHSFHFGFNVEPVNGQFQFDSLTYHGDEQRSGADYLTIFRIPGAMRANLFTYWKPTEDVVKSFSANPRRSLTEIMPGLRDILGEFVISSNVERFGIDLYTLDDTVIPGVIYIADACQSVCPATGTGLSKVFTDVDVLLDDKISLWLDTPGMGTDKIHEYYADARKIHTDDRSVNLAMRRRRTAVEVSNIRFQVERLLSRRRAQKSLA